MGDKTTSQIPLPLWSANMCLVACNPDVTGWVFYSSRRDKDLGDEEPHKGSRSDTHPDTRSVGAKVCFSLPAARPLTDGSQVA